MKSNFIRLQSNQLISFHGVDSEVLPTGGYKFRFKVPILSAYSIEYFIFHEGALSSTYSNSSILNSGCYIQNFTELVIESNFPRYSDAEFAITIFYHGIRDYDSLFHWVANPALKTRLGKYYEESEKCFEAGATLPFLLMCGAIFEGILEAKGIPGTFNQKIPASGFSSQTKALMVKTKDLRNVIHGNRFAELYPTLTDFMDIRKELDTLVLSFT